MPSKNLLTLIGHMARDPEILVSKSGRDYAKFTVPWDKRKKVGDKWETQETIWFNVMAFGDVVESVRGFRKGDAVLVEGPVSASIFQSRDGTSKISMNVIANKAELIKAKGGREEGVDEYGEQEADIPF
jgi:single-strand DNA-binding protein